MLPQPRKPARILTIKQPKNTHQIYEQTIAEKFIHEKKFVGFEDMERFKAKEGTDVAPVVDFSDKE